MSGRYQVRRLCAALEVSRSGYYGWKRRRHSPCRRQRENEVLSVRIKEEFERSRRTYGSPRLARELKVGRHRVARLMRQARIWARQQSKFRVATTDSRHNHTIAPNLLPEVKISRCNQAWCTDATALLTAEGWLYVVAVLDLHSRRIVGWAMAAYLDAELAISALKMAISERRPTAALIVHSDRGSQVACHAYKAILQKHNLVASMSRQGNCYDNAFIESFWSSLKYELAYRQRFTSRAVVRTAVFDYIEAFYNRARLHSSLGYISPVQFESNQQKPS